MSSRKSKPRIYRELLWLSEQEFHEQVPFRKNKDNCPVIFYISKSGALHCHPPLDPKNYRVFVTPEKI